MHTAKDVLDKASVLFQIEIFKVKNDGHAHNSEIKFQVENQVTTPLSPTPTKANMFFSIYYSV